MLNLIFFILVFGILVLVHELGHFLVAKKYGVKVEEFGFGFGRRLYKRKHKDTLYSINLIPLGGFVKLFGEDGSFPKNPKSFTNKTKLQRTQILIAGVLMNFILTIFLLAVGYGIGMTSLIPGMWEHKGVINNQKVEIVDVYSEYPAEKGGLKKGDFILKINEKPIFFATEMSNFITQIKEKNFFLTIQRSGSQKIVKIEKDPSKEVIGVVLETQGAIKASVFWAPVVAFEETIRLAKINLIGITQFFAKIFTKFRVGEEATGPIGIYYLTGYFAKMGAMSFLQFVAILSLVLSLVNVLPIPILDGGHILLLGVEGLTKKRITPETRGLINLVGLSFLIFLLISITLKDIGRFEIFKTIRNFLKI